MKKLLLCVMILGGVFLQVKDIDADVKKVALQAWSKTSDAFQKLAERGVTGVDNQTKSQYLLVRFFKGQDEKPESGPFYYFVSPEKTDILDHETGTFSYFQSLLKGREELFVKAVPVQLPKLQEKNNHLVLSRDDLKDKRQQEIVLDKKGMLDRELVAKPGGQRADKNEVKITNKSGDSLLVEIDYQYKSLVIKAAEKVGKVKEFWLIKNGVSVNIPFTQKKAEVFTLDLNKIAFTVVTTSNVLQANVEDASAFIVDDKWGKVEIAPCKIEGEYCIVK
ncbi:hypothetical protein CVU75_03180 [Candidatus Dependentiae bacterium HGW-Dependentiae-1]|nr:MAG: hypothetical protein CVU75_03180 [Candidatus Dependentiae bacterium HGW-Dependentiae-1]